MESTRVTTGEFQRAFGVWTEKAAEKPVTITKEGRDHLVVLSADEYARLKRRDRQVGRASELPEEWVDAVRKARVPDEYAHLDAELK
jgi:PHD/YefM family antitoxin component YafN of YafNO toxin-antitoxin module